MRLNSALRPCLALLLVAPAFSASAQVSEEEEEEEELALVYGDKSNVSIATGTAQSLRRAPAVASVITAQDIAAMGATDLDHVLESTAGIHVSRSPNQYSPLFVVRGIYSAYLSQVLVLQNGIPVTSAYLNNKGNVWGGWPVEHIARIEVIRGPGSALYGSDAFAGVINIITKGPADTRGTELGVRVGSFATRDAWLQHGGKLGAANVALYLRAGAALATGALSKPTPRAATTPSSAPAPRSPAARSTSATTPSMATSTSATTSGGFAPATKGATMSAPAPASPTRSIPWANPRVNG